MTWISENNLVSAIVMLVGLGVIAAGSMNKVSLRKKLNATKSKTNKPFGVNLILFTLRLKDLIEACIDKKVNLVVFAEDFQKKTH